MPDKKSNKKAEKNGKQRTPRRAQARRVLVTERLADGALGRRKKPTMKRKRRYSNKELLFVRGEKGRIIKSRVIGRRSPREADRVAD